MKQKSPDKKQKTLHTKLKPRDAKQKTIVKKQNSPDTKQSTPDTRQKAPAGRKKFTLEYIIRSSPAILFEFVTQPDGLAQWFSDVCDAQDDIYVFGWGKDFQRARQVDLIEGESVQYHWEHGNQGEYFGFKVYKSEIADDTVLEITDFADAKEVKEQTFLWDKQVDDLKHAIGA